MKVLVTGARGFIGSFLVERLLEQGCQVHCLLRHKAQSNPWLDGLDFTTIAGDLSDKKLNLDAGDFDYVYHLAGLTKAARREDFDLVNVQGTRNLLNAVVASSPRLQRFVLVSSLAGAGPSPDGKPISEEDVPAPVSDYGRSKLRAEEVTNGFSDRLPITLVRPPAVYGPRDSDVLTYFKYAQKGLRPVLGGGPRTASFVFVHDLVEGILLAATKPEAIGRTYYLCDDRPYTWDELGQTIAATLGAKTVRLNMPLFAVFLAALASDLVSRISGTPSIINLDKYKELKEKHWVCSARRAEEELGFSAKHSLQEGIAATAEWYSAQGWL